MIKALGQAAFLAALTLGMAAPASAAVQMDQSQYCASTAWQRCFNKYGYTSQECEEAEYWLCMQEPWDGDPIAYRPERGVGSA